MSNQHELNLHHLFFNFLHAAHLKTYAGTDLDRKKTKRIASKILGHQEYFYRKKIGFILTATPDIHFRQAKK